MQPKVDVLTLALVSILGVRVVGRRADTLARLDALLVLSAVAVAAALHLVGRAATVRVAGAALGARALERADQVDAVGADTARRTAVRGGLRALVHVWTRRNACDVSGMSIPGISTVASLRPVDELKSFSTCAADRHGN